MRQCLGLKCLGIAFSLVMVLPFVDGSDQHAHAQTVVAQNTSGAKKTPQRRSPRAAKAKDATADGKSGRAPAEIDKQLDAAAKSLTAGDADGATKTLDSVLAGGGLGNKHVARALYLRGVSHRKKGRPAQALADLTSAVWLKDGLNEADRAAALKERNEVSGELGVAESGAPASVASSGPLPSAAQSTTQQPSSQTSLLKPPSASSAVFSDTGFPPTASPPRRAPPPRDAAPSAAPATSSWQSETQVERKAAPAAPSTKTAAKNPPKVQAPGKTPQTAGEGLGEFLSGLFGGGSSKPTAQPQQRSAWAPSTTTDAPAQTASVPAGRGKRPAESSSIATSAVSQTGAYRLQVATLRSRTEADAVASRLRKEHGPIIGAHKLDVDQTVYGNMGTFYRVRLGPFGSANEPKALCDQLRPKGYDCLVVTN